VINAIRYADDKVVTLVNGITEIYGPHQ